MKRGQVFVRAKFDDGRWGNCDIFDLDEESFRAFVIDRLILLGARIVRLPDEDPTVEREFRAKDGVERE